jgi:hypothetical protein
LKKVRSAFTKRLPLFVFKYIQKNSRDIRISAKEVEKLLPHLFFLPKKQQGGRTTP